MADAAAIRPKPTRHRTPCSPVAVVVFLIYVHSRLTLPYLRHLLLFIFLNLLYPFFDRPAHPTLPTNWCKARQLLRGDAQVKCLLFISGAAAAAPPLRLSPFSVSAQTTRLIIFKRWLTRGLTLGFKVMTQKEQVSSGVPHPPVSHTDGAEF